jgi:hypothetical protein
MNNWETVLLLSIPVITTLILIHTIFLHILTKQEPTKGIEKMYTPIPSPGDRHGAAIVAEEHISVRRPQILHENLFDTLVRLGAIPESMRHLKDSSSQKDVIALGITILLQAAEFMPDNTASEAIAARSIVQKADQEEKNRMQAEYLKKLITVPPPSWVHNTGGLLAQYQNALNSSVTSFTGHAQIQPYSPSVKTLSGMGSGGCGGVSYTTSVNHDQAKTVLEELNKADAETGGISTTTKGN